MFCSLISRSTLCALALLCLLCFVGCSNSDDNPAGDDGDHAEVFGVQLLLGNDTLAVADGTIVTGGVSVAVGDTLGPIAVWFSDEDSHWNLGASEEGTSLDIRLQSDIPALAIKSDTSEWHFNLAGVADGTTALRVVILHEGHDDFVSPQIPVVVTDTP